MLTIIDEVFCSLVLTQKNQKVKAGKYSAEICFASLRKMKLVSPSAPLKQHFPPHASLNRFCRPAITGFDNDAASRKAGPNAKYFQAVQQLNFNE